MSPTGKRSDPYSAYRFKVQIEGIITAGFTDVSGLTIETEVETIKEGGVNNYEYKLPKFTKYSNITLKRGLIDLKLWDWYQTVISGKFKRKSGTIYLLDYSGNKTLDYYDFYEAYPIKWEGPTFNAKNSTVASETLVLAHKHLIKAIK
ncbi:MAG: phage tail protein [Methanosarcinales archaeon]|nr:phage tail protein [Methanosarcinales archaeon]